jgi:hypothetical protein
VQEDRDAVQAGRGDPAGRKGGGMQVERDELREDLALSKSIQAEATAAVAA